MGTCNLEVDCYSGIHVRLHYLSVRNIHRAHVCITVFTFEVLVDQSNVRTHEASVQHVLLLTCDCLATRRMNKRV